MRAEAEKSQRVPIEQTGSILTVLATGPDQAGNASAIHRMFPYATLFYRITAKREFKQTIEQFARRNLPAV